ncbi:MAG: hypothetical protein GYA62_04325 [Bacteroidales bacterium]|nr:hypothetical protein [Bacteroidales bacterium]
MQFPEFIKLNYTYKKPESEVWVLNTDDLPLEKELIKDTQIVHLAPKSIGGNHKHSRIEWFIGIGDMEFVWQNEKGETQKEHMNPNGQITLIKVPPFVAHTVVNKSEDKPGILFEMANAKMSDAEIVKII